MQHAITVTRSVRGDLDAENEFPMSEPNRVLSIRTSKGPRGLTTTASSCVVERHEGYSTRTFALFGDFRKAIVTTSKRATEKAIREQHAAALADVDALLAEAEAFYTAKKVAA